MRAISATLTVGLGKVASRFVEDMLTGMLIAGSVRLTEIARALDESIPLHSTHKRLSRNLGNPRIGEMVAGNLLEAGANMVRDDTLLVIDVFELVKLYAEKMEYLAAPLPPSGRGTGSGAWYPRPTRRASRVPGLRDLRLGYRRWADVRPVGPRPGTRNGVV